MLRQTRKLIGRFMAMLVEDGSEKGTPLSEWAAPKNQFKLVTRGELLSVLKNLKALSDPETEDAQKTG